MGQGGRARLLASSIRRAPGSRPTSRRPSSTNVRVGQRARSWSTSTPTPPGTREVDSISPATGAEFAMLPPQNATGQLGQGGAAPAGADRRAPPARAAAAARRHDRDRHDRHRARPAAGEARQGCRRRGPWREVRAAAGALPDRSCSGSAWGSPLTAALAAAHRRPRRSEVPSRSRSTRRSCPRRS